MYNENSSSPILNNVTFTDNTAGRNGGGIYSNSSSPILTDVTFNGNSAASGGGMYNDASSSSTLTNVIFEGNTTTNSGAGAFNHSSTPIFFNVTFKNNIADNSGGAVYNYASSNSVFTNVFITNNSAVNSYGGGIANYDGSSPILTNVLISHNDAGNSGGGVYNQSSSSPVFYNVTISENTSVSNGGGGIRNNSTCTTKLYNSIVWGNTGGGTLANNNFMYSGSSSSEFYNSLVQGSGGSGSSWVASFGTDGGNNIDVDPEFVGGGYYALRLYSPAVNAGDNSLYSGTLATDKDVAGGDRLVGTNIDLGAYEFQTIQPDANNVIYVKKGSGGDGSSWTNALGEVAEALTWARQNPTLVGSGLQIYVAKGTYYPYFHGADLNYTNGNRQNSFVMLENVQLYGGFDPDNGIEDLNDTRIFGSGGSILSGDIGIANDNSDNVYHVVIFSGNAGTAGLDGFTVRDGNTSTASSNITVNGLLIGTRNGGGVYNNSSSPTIANVILTNNTASRYGAGMYSEDFSSPILNNVTFTENTAGTAGGGMYNNESSPVLTEVTITDNTATGSSGDGAGMYNNASSSPILNIVTITGNTAGRNGGGVYNTSSSPTLTHVIINSNAAGYGGGMYNEVSSSPTLTDVTIEGNTTTGQGAGVLNKASSPSFVNVTFKNNIANTSGGAVYNDNVSNPVFTNVFITNNTAVSSYGGGIANYGTSSPILTNVLISDNTAGNSGGGVINQSNSSPTFYNVTISGNTAVSGGGGVRNNSNCFPEFYNSIIWGNTGGTTVANDNFMYSGSSSSEFYNSLVQGSNGSGSSWVSTYGTDGGNNIDVDPQFADAGNGDYSIPNTSPAVNAGDTSYYTGNLNSDTDLVGTERVYGYAFGGIIDMGAYESKGINTTPLASTNAPICEGADLELYAEGGIAFEWSGPGSFTSTDQNPTISNANTTNNGGIYSVKIYNNPTDFVTKTVNVIFHSLPTIAITSNTPPVCVGNTIALDATTSGTIYEWSGPNSFTSAIKSPIIPNAQTTNSGTYTLKVTDGNGCINTDDVTITVNALPTAAASATTPICEGETLDLSVTTDNGTTFAWTHLSSTYTSTTQNPSRANALPAMSGTYKVTVTDAIGCSNESTVAVTVNALPTPTAGNNGPLCSGSQLNLTASGGTSYQWSGPDGFTSTAQNPTIATAQNSINDGTYTVKVTDVNGCSKTTTTDVIIHALPYVSVISNSPLCVGEALIFNTTTGGTSYAWTGPSGFNSTDQSPTITNAQTTNAGNYTIEVTDAKSCKNTATVSVTVNPLPTVSATSNSPVCAGETLNFTGTTNGTSFEWYNSGGYSSYDQNPSITNAQPSMSGTYTFRVTDAKSCKNTATVSVTVNPLPTVSASSNSPVCQDGTLNLSASGSGTSFVWSGPQSFSSTDQNPTITSAQPNMSGVYTVTATDVNTCSDQATTSVTINALPNATATSNSPVCENATIELEADGGTSYSWTDPDGIFLSTAQKPTITNAQMSHGGTYTVVVTDGKGCSKTVTTTVTMVPLVTPTASSNTPVCERGELKLFGGETSGATGVTYSWTGPDNFTSTDQNPILSNVTMDAYGTYTVTASAAGYCDATSTTPVIINLRPIIAETVSPGLDGTSHCYGSTIQIGVTSGMTYSWTGPNGFTAGNVNTITLSNMTTAHSGTYTVIGSNAYCSDTLDIGITVHPEVIATASSNSPVCEGDDIELEATGGASYSWTGPNGYTSTAQNPVITNAQSSHMGTYTVTVTDAHGCSETAMTNVTTKPNFVVTASSNTSVCEDDTLKLFATSGGTSYSWTGPNGFTSTDQNPVIAPATMDAYGVYTVTASGSGSCDGKSSTSVVINLKPRLYLLQDTTVCEGETVYFGGTGGIVYNWAGPNGFSATTSTFAITNASVAHSGTYHVTTSNYTCQDTGSFKLSVLPKPSITANSNSPICLGDNIELTATGGTTYSWIGPNGFTSTSQNPVINNAQLSMGGDYIVTAANAHGCTNKDTVSVSINSLITASASSNTPVCEEGTIELTASGGTSYSWTGPNGFTSTAQNPVITNVNTNDAGVYTVTISSPGSCDATINTAVVVNLKPVNIAYYTSPICEGQTLYLGTTGGMTYQWTGPNGFTSTQNSPVIQNVSKTLHEGAYTVVASNGYCTDTDIVNVIITPGPTIVASSNSPVCEGDAINFSVTNGSSYAWTGPNNFSSNVQNPSILVADSIHNGTYSVTVSDAQGCTSTKEVTVAVNSKPTLTASSNSPICEGSTLNLLANGGVSYSWTGPNGFTSTSQNPSITNATLNADGVYQVTVIGSNGCSETTNIAVSINEQPNISVTATDPICVGQTLYLRATGGISYSWSGPNGFNSNSSSPQISNVTANHSGTYNVLVTGSNGCTKEGSVNVSISAPLAITASSNSSVCEGTALNLYATGGATYSWTGPNGFTSTDQNPVIDDANMGHYGKFTVTAIGSNGCIGTASTNVAIDLKPHASAGANSPLCEGQVLYLQGKGGMTYSWTGPNSFSSTQPSPIIGNADQSMNGQYRVIARNSYGCFDTAFVSVMVTSGPAVTASYNAPVSPGGTLALTANSNASTYKWSGPNGFLSASKTSMIYNVQPKAAGTYTVTVKDAEGCVNSSSVTVVIGGGSGQAAMRPAANNNVLPQIMLFPNPASNVVTVKNDKNEPMATVQVYNALGQIVYSGNAEGAVKYQLTVSGYASGLYNVKVILGDGTQLQSKFQVAK